MKNIREVDVKGKRVFLRADLDVPVEDKRVVDDTRIRTSLPTIRFLVRQQAIVIIAAHLDRPEGRVVESLRMDPVAGRLGGLGHFRNLTKTDDCVGGAVVEAVLKTNPGGIIVLENLRFHSEEETNDPTFAKELASLVDLYVNDCFSASHRTHASLVSVSKLLPAFAGFALQKEIKLLQRFLRELKHPLVVILGGAKKDKLSLLPDFLKMADFVLVGGKLARWKMPNFLGHPELVSGSRSGFLHPSVVEMTGGKGNRSFLVVGKGKDDIDGRTIKRFVEIIKKAKTIIWSGPMGKFEEGFVEGTRAIAEAVVKSGAKSIVGGGDTEAILDKLGLIEKMGYVSPAGGAMLTFLAGHKLPGLEALGYYTDTST